MHADERIDIVYLWVDGADPAWQARRRKALGLGAPERPAPHGDVQGRYRDNGELRFNLRALERFFPTHGHVFIVTDGQTPSWLRPSEGLSIVDHRALMPAAKLPVFDSGHIESYLHHLPGLAERFIYLNDDVFFGAPVDPAVWFGPAGVAVFRERANVPAYAGPQPFESALVNASLLSQAWLSARDPLYRHVPRIFAHSPRPMLKSALDELESAAPELFSQVRSSVFRSWAVPPLLPDLVPRWLLHTGRALELENNGMYLRTGAADAARQFEQLRARFGRLPFFCINDTSDEAAPDAPELLQVGQNLARLLPAPSRFERAGVCSVRRRTAPYACATTAAADIRSSISASAFLPDMPCGLSSAHSE
ncbi:Stealth CR1 domain-containing protein [Massilia glaciei]|uniref:Exopolysaccharide phosphotransferase n=1 Tax=Massilia glaciei TaxID=1524097 RepID=A0A2U2HGQ4_9BURK|nr:Stealth CR1 domain-containing protein [Massilia glaciei]PWF44373.1 exopolysaccharide phosphotransferase [Massilia glaciei]